MKNPMKFLSLILVSILIQGSIAGASTRITDLNGMALVTSLPNGAPDAVERTGESFRVAVPLSQRTENATAVLVGGGGVMFMSGIFLATGIPGIALETIEGLTTIGGATYAFLKSARVYYIPASKLDLLKTILQQSEFTADVDYYPTLALCPQAALRAISGWSAESLYENFPKCSILGTDTEKHHLFQKVVDQVKAMSDS